jgi:hypothetical protein
MHADAQDGMRGRWDGSHAEALPAVGGGYRKGLSANDIAQSFGRSVPRPCPATCPDRASYGDFFGE